MNKRKSIILFASTDLNFDQRLQRISKTLSQEYDVLLVGRKLKNSPKLKERDFKQKRFHCLFNKGVLFYLEINLRIFIYLLFHKYDFVVANDLDTIIGVHYGTRFQQATKVFDAHELFTEVPELQNKKWKKKLWKWIEKKYVKYFDLHYTVNKSLANIFKQNLNISFEIVRNVPLKSTFKKYKGKKEKYILYQGALNKGRGLKEIILAIKNIDIKLKIAGSGDIEDELKRLVIENALEEKVTFLGKLEPLELQKITQAAFIGLNLLENKSKNYYFSLANKFFDYIQEEIPQICMNFPEYKLLNKENNVAILVKNLDKATLVNAVKKFNDENLHKELKRNCKKAKEFYCWENEQEVLLAIYSLIDKR